ncbi:hypothetical protein ACFRMQ_25970 [Kitasatospora sp. NPDC056783]|uniref:hypothetical protein n=1 Tax=Kitasatospora sp. NPDC056783 TaxID=3345943 RepID=UPI003687F76A
MVLAALVAAGVGVTPGIAQAAGPSAPPAKAAPAKGAPAEGAPTANGAAASETDAVRKLAGKTFSSPAERTVVSPKADGQKADGRAADGRAGLAAPAQGAQGNWYPYISLDAFAGDAHGVEMRTYVSAYDSSSLEVTIDWGDGKTDTYTADLTASGFGSDQRTNKHRYSAVGTYDIKVTIKDTTLGQEASNSLRIVTGGGEFTPHAPTRLLDTRAGIGAAQAKVPARGTVALKVAGVAQVPADVSAVVLNVTVTNATADGHISTAALKDLAESTDTSSLNYAAGQTVPNMVISGVKDGYVYLFNAGWQPVDLLADVTGYFTPTTASGYKSMPQVRAVDTREGLGTAKGQAPGLSSFDVAVAGRNGVPNNATAVAVTLTVTGPQDAGHLTAYPAGQAAPSTSTLNFVGGQTVANAAIVPLGADGKISIRNGSWKPADVVLDVVGYFTPDSRAAYVPGYSALRLVDSRKDSWGRKAAPLAARSFYAMRYEADTREPRVDGWVLNTTVTNTSGPGFLSVAPDPNFWSDYQNGTPAVPQRPVSSTLNWTAGQTVAGVAQTAGGKGGMIDIWNQGWQDVDFIIDLAGYYQSI